jgi:hypothetical protein
LVCTGHASQRHRIPSRHSGQKPLKQAERVLTKRRFFLSTGSTLTGRHPTLFGENHRHYQEQKSKTKEAKNEVFLTLNRFRKTSILMSGKFPFGDHPQSRIPDFIANN